MVAPCRERAHAVVPVCFVQVLTYMIKDGRFKSQKNKNFKGHNTAGYACQVNTSPDGK